MKCKTHKIVFEIAAEDFIERMGRPPCNKEEFQHFCELTEKGLRNGHIDWDVLFDCVKEAFD